MKRISKIALALLFLPLMALAAPPCGRLTLASGKPIMPLGDLVSSTIYYTPYICGTVPAWNGAAWVDTPFVELSLSLSGSVAGEIRDIFYVSGVLELGAPWSGNEQRSVPVYMVQGGWVTPSGKTYLGTVYITENGQTRFQTKPAPQWYGSNNRLGVWNAYNRVWVRAVNRDLAPLWGYGASSIRFANNSEYLSVTWVDGLAQSTSHCRYISSVAGQNASPAAATVGCGLEQYSYPLNWNGFLGQAALNSTALGMAVEGSDMTDGRLGKRRWNAQEQSTGITILFYGNNFSALIVDVEM